MNTALYTACTIASALALTFRLPALVRNPDPGILALCCYFVLSAATFGVSIPWVYVAVTEFVGVRNISGLIAQCGGVSIAVAQQAVVLTWKYPWNRAKPAVLLRLTLLVFTITGMIALFVASISQMIDSPRNFAADSARIPTYSIYLLVFQTCFIIGTLESARLCWRYSSDVGPGWLRRGLRTAAVGSSLGLPYSAVRLSSIAIAHLGGDPTRWEPIARLGAGGGTLILVAGFTMPAWGPRLSIASARIARYRAYRRIDPLWRAIYDAVPEIALTAPKNGDLCRWRRFDFHLYRRLVEIRDGRTALLPFFDSEVAAKMRSKAEEHGLRGQRLEAAVEAANLAAAITAKKRFQGPCPPLVDISSTQPEQFEQIGDNLHEEVEWLSMVGREFADSTLVATVLPKTTLWDSSGQQGDPAKHTLRRPSSP